MPVPSPESELARLPELLRTYEETRATVLEDGLVDRELKELCARYLADDPDAAGGDERQRAALRWAHAVAWDSDAADDELWAGLHAHFSEPELVELGYFIAFTLGQQHWLATLGAREDE
jgi:alkylhydroperoxidase family enzyme